MRIIAGEFRGRKLLPPEGQTTRPITDRVKQSLFDILTPLLPAARVYDCFSGTGSLGLEAISRGAAHATFFEADRSAAQLLRRNITAINVQDRCEIIEGDLFNWFAAAPAQPPQRRVAIVFLDPPYRFLRERKRDLQQLVADMRGHHLAPAATIAFRHDATDDMSFDEIERYDRREYGGMAIDLLRPQPDTPSF